MAPGNQRRVGIIGASGYTGVELLRLCAGHPELVVSYASANTLAGTRASDRYPSLAGAYPDFLLEAFDPAAVDGLDLVFLALPHGTSQDLMPDLRKRVGHVVDLAADFRLKDPSLYPIWYGEEHRCPELLADFAFGIPELFREQLRNAPLIAAAGCYVTAAALALTPLVRAGVIAADGVIVDAASGVSGAGAGLKLSTSYGTVNEDFTAYGLLTHRHTPEIEQATGARVLFTPHLAPMTRGILATCYARPTAAAGLGPRRAEEPAPPVGAGARGGRTSTTSTADTGAVLDVLRDAYAGEPFIIVRESSPSTKATLGSNCVHLTARFDERTGWILVIAALDNLTKGASGQALQCANLALGLAETAGLPTVGLYP